MIKLTRFGKTDFDKFISWITNQELLITIAGTDFTYPLTVQQLNQYLKSPKSLSFNVVNVEDSKPIGHAEIILTGANTCKLDKILIGDKSMRGKGVGEILMKKLLDYSFTELAMTEIELNVYDWNIGGIKCYKKVGFTINSDKSIITKIGGGRWTALNMIIDKNKFESANSNN